MDEIQLYNDFIDGKLEIEEEKKLFEMLSLDDEFHSDFRQFLLIKNAIQSFQESDEMSKVETAALFSSLGMKTDEELIVLEAEQANKLKQKKTFYRGIYVGCLTTALIGLCLFFIINSKSPKDNVSMNINRKNTNKVVTKKNLSLPSIEIPKIAAYEKKSYYKPSNAQTTEDKIFNESTLAKVEVIPTLEKSNYSMNLTHIQLDNIANFGANKFNYYPIMNANNLAILNLSSLSDFSVEIANSAVRNTLKEKITNSKSSAFNNLCLSLNYTLNNYLLTGFEVRAESYYLEYTRNEGINTEFKYLQQSNVTTFGTKIAVQPIDIMNVKPNIQFGLGFNKYGLALRPEVGLEYKPYDNMAFVFGLEYSYYFYKQDGKWYNTSKIGLNYGFKVLL